jgi:hypothetical protein
MLKQVFAPLAVHDFESGAHLLAAVLTKRVAIRFGTAAVVMTLWRFWPRFGELLKRPVAHALREYASVRWIASEIVSCATDALAYKWAFSGFSDAIRQPHLIPTWQHAFIAGEGYPWRFLPVIPPLSVFTTISYDWYLSTKRVEFGPELLRMDLANAAKERVLPLVNIFVQAVQGTAEYPLSRQLGLWAMDSSLTFGARAASNLAWRRLGRNHPVLAAMFCTFAFPLTGGMIIGVVRGVVEARITATLKETNREQLESVLEMPAKRQIAATIMAEQEDGALRGEQPLAQLEKRQLRGMLDIGIQFIDARRMTHGARLAMLQSLRNLSFYIDASDRGEMENGAAGVLSKFSRRVKFTAAEGVESSVSSLRGPDADGHTHTQSCAVCIGEYEDGDELAELVCGHLYHVECVREWLTKHKECPLCRHDIRARADSTTVQPAHATAEVYRERVRAWARSTVPRNLELAKWGEIANFARMHGLLIPEPFLGRLADDFMSPVATPQDCSVLETLLASVLEIVLEVQPASFDRTS